VDIHIDKGQIVSIVGSSGAGKSTLLHILGTLDSPDKGKVMLNNKRTDRLFGKALAHFRNTHIGFIFQFHHLLPEFTALENVSIPGWIAGKKKKEVVGRATELLHNLGLGERLDNKPHQLSGGEQQRVAVARALINQPAIVMADEPTGNLDSANGRELHKLFIELRDAYQQTFLIVTHNEELARMGDRIVQMKDGLINNE
jgi:lipoprotein-releasing system ATP-binding protein